MIRARLLLPVAFFLLLGGCKVGPNYARPTLDVPAQYRSLAPTVPAPTQTNQPPAGQATPNFGEEKWWTVFKDPVLEKLVREALANNYDLRIAATRVMQARDLVAIARADQLPQASGTAGIQQVRNQLFLGAPTLDSVAVQASYIIDFWGQYRRATEAARANLVATEYGQDTVRMTIVSDVASDYFTLRAYDAQLEYSKKTLAANQDLLKLNNDRFKGGESAITDVLQAELLVQQTEAQIITLLQSIAQTENAVSVLLGRNPGPIDRGIGLTEQPLTPDVPAGIPSSLLERRPDVHQAEMNLVAANANVGVAKAAFFPQFSLTGLFGATSTSVTSFLNGPATAWAIGGQALQPLYQGGRIRANYRLAWAERDQSELAYRQSVQLAVTDVSNSLIGYAQSREYRKKLQEQTSTYFEAARLADVRFRGGYTSFLEVLVTQQQYFTSELALADAWNAELQNYVGLYRALGGGWEQ
jgi:outer membrane protein, multidrug efflux system